VAAIMGRKSVMHTSWELGERKSGMSRISSVKILRLLLFYIVVANCDFVSAQVSTPEGDGDNAAANSKNVSELLEKLDRLVEQNGQLERQNLEFGPGFGDFEHHEKLATRLAAHFKRSDEDKQEQPNSDQFENTQIRVEDGSVIFTPNLFGQGIAITDVTYKMSAFDGGLKYHGLSLEGEYFLRWLDHFSGPGTSGLVPIFSHGFQMQTSAMVMPNTLQLYVGGSTLYGKYGNRWDFRAGVNYSPFQNRVLRWNNEFLYL